MIDRIMASGEKKVVSGRNHGETIPSIFSHKGVKLCMGQWKKTSCYNCGVCCGLEVKIENNQVVNVADKSQYAT